jgi:hypothetical protein
MLFQNRIQNPLTNNEASLFFSQSPVEKIAKKTLNNQKQCGNPCVTYMLGIVEWHIMNLDYLLKIYSYQTLLRL